MKVGFTGTQHGMTEAQKETLREFLEYPGIDEVHHGDCVGADEQAHHIIRGLSNLRWRDHVRIIVHPPLVNSKRAWMLGDIAVPPRDYLKRNRNIVDETDVLVACPQQGVEPGSIRGQGTWYTIRYARKQQKRIWIILPSGEISE